MFRNLIIAALLLSTGAAQAEVKLVFELDEAIIKASDQADTPALIYLTQNNKSLALQLVCKGKPTVIIFDKTPLVTMSVPSPDDLLGEAKINRKDCEKIANCVLAKSITKDAFITISVNSETEAFSLDSIGKNCEEANLK
jgi:hypothetical protein